MRSSRPTATGARTNGRARSNGRPSTSAEARPRKHAEWELRLYVAGQTPRSIQAFANLRRLCETHLDGRYTIEVIDIFKNPTLAEDDQILAVPTLVRRLPVPVKRVIGDLSNTLNVLIGLDLKPAQQKSDEP